MEKFRQIAEEWFEKTQTLRIECVDYIERVLSENGNRLEWDDSELAESVCISYDGGNHPEYASNCFSTLRGIDMDANGNITFCIEDDSEYPLENVPTYDLYDVCDFIENNLFEEID